jgi:hypothetical protein
VEGRTLKFSAFHGAPSRQPAKNRACTSLSLVCVLHFRRSKSDVSPPGQAFVDGSLVRLHAARKAHLPDMARLTFSQRPLQQLVWSHCTAMKPVMVFKMSSPALVRVLEADRRAVVIRHHKFSVYSSGWRIQNGPEKASFLA